MLEDVTLGVFDGENMVAVTGRVYMVPPNYASKSKLIEGDQLILRMSEDGKYIYKQLAQIPRRAAKGKVIRADKNREFVVASEGIHYKVLPATGTYFHLRVGQEVSLILPLRPGNWAAVNYVINAEDLDKEF